MSDKVIQFPARDPDEPYPGAYAEHEAEHNAFVLDLVKTALEKYHGAHELDEWLVTDPYLVQWPRVADALRELCKGTPIF